MIDDWLSASKILRQLDDGRVAKDIAEAENVPHSRPAKPVDALIVVADNGQPGPIAGQLSQDLLLCGARVLIFIDQDFLELPAEVFFDLRRTSEQIQRGALKHAKIHKASLNHQLTITRIGIDDTFLFLKKSQPAFPLLCSCLRMFDCRLRRSLFGSPPSAARTTARVVPAGPARPWQD